MPIKKNVCVDCSVTINLFSPISIQYLRKLSGGQHFTKIDLADAYNQILLSPDSQKRLALSPHRAVLLQQRLPFVTFSAPGYFQEIMDQLAQNLSDVDVYSNDILISGVSPETYRLRDKGLRCRLGKRDFAQSSVEYRGFKLSKGGISKGHKVDAFINMPAAKYMYLISSLFLVNFDSTAIVIRISQLL